MWHCKQLPLDTTRTDLTRFLTHLNALSEDYFATDEPIMVARAPGRLDLMGGIADYSGALVLELPLSLATIVAVQATTDPSISVYSTAASEFAGEPMISLPLASLRDGDLPLSYADARALLTGNPQHAWAAYVIGVLVVLQQEYGLIPEHGVRILIHCEVPIGKGVSSSAALEVATMQALSTLYGLPLVGRELGLLCQKVENLVVGAPCGAMDQITSACGEYGSLLALLCQPAELQGSVPLPSDVEIWGIDSGIRHAVVGADYGSVRVGAFMGYRIIADLQGFPIAKKENGTVAVSDPLWQGYLANIAPSLWETKYREQVPVALDGASFLERYGGSTDSVTRIDPQRTYAVRQPTAHPIYEHHRVQLFRALLTKGAVAEEQRILLGELMYQSHASYSACGLGSAGTDRLVELVRQAGPAAGLYGAKITGGGSGGTVAILARRGVEEQIRQIAAAYERETGIQTSILHGSSPGAKAWGIVECVCE